MVYKCSGANLLIFFIFFTFASSLYGQHRPARNTLPELSAATKRKLDWLDTYGTPIRVGMDKSPNLGRRTEFACRKGRYDLVRKDWGLNKTKVNQELVPCPNFF
ncbi:MAG: hypothetical protein QNL04_05490 [SAR324 cluster bacterium]|nr:hypothetical protein [SAR324 cluster bacterium]